MTLYEKILLSIPENVAFYMGDWKEIANGFALKRDGSTRFPAIIISPDYTEKEKELIFNSYDITIFICYPTNKNFTHIQRDKDIFEKCIIPIWEELKENFKYNKYICTSYDGGKYDAELKRVPWENVDKTKLNDIVDVLQIDIKDFKVWLNYSNEF